MNTSAKHVIDKCGGPQVVANLIGIDLASVHKWKYPRSKGGTGGLVPTNRQHELMRLAREAGIDLVPDDFFQPPPPTNLPAPTPASEEKAA